MQRGGDVLERRLGRVRLRLEVHLEELVEKDDGTAGTCLEQERFDEGARDRVLAVQEVASTGRRLSPRVLAGQGVDVEENRVDETLRSA